MRFTFVSIGALFALASSCAAAPLVIPAQGNPDAFRFRGVSGPGLGLGPKLPLLGPGGNPILPTEFKRSEANIAVANTHAPNLLNGLESSAGNFDDSLTKRLSFPPPQTPEEAAAIAAFQEQQRKIFEFLQHGRLPSEFSTGSGLKDNGENLVNPPTKRLFRSPPPGTLEAAAMAALEEKQRQISELLRSINGPLADKINTSSKRGFFDIISQIFGSGSQTQPTQIGGINICGIVVDGVVPNPCPKT